VKSDSASPRGTKARLHEQAAVAYKLDLPEWYEEGTTVAEFRAVLALLEAAHDRAMAEGVPVQVTAPIPYRVKGGITEIPAD